MYITTPIDKAPEVQAASCPVAAPCVQPLQLYISTLGVVFAIYCLAAYLLRHRFLLHVRAKKKVLLARSLLVLFWICLAVASLYTFKIEYAPANGREIEGVLLRGRNLPDAWPPLFKKIPT